MQKLCGQRRVALIVTASNLCRGVISVAGMCRVNCNKDIYLVNQDNRYISEKLPHWKRARQEKAQPFNYSGNLAWANVFKVQLARQHTATKISTIEFFSGPLVDILRVIAKSTSTNNNNKQSTDTQPTSYTISTHLSSTNLPYIPENCFRKLRCEVVQGAVCGLQTPIFQMENTKCERTRSVNAH